MTTPTGRVTVTLKAGAERYACTYIRTDGSPRLVEDPANSSLPLFIDGLEHARTYVAVLEADAQWGRSFGLQRLVAYELGVGPPGIEQDGAYSFDGHVVGFKFEKVAP